MRSFRLSCTCVWFILLPAVSICGWTAIPVDVNIAANVYTPTTELYVLLTWPSTDGISQYNLYRKTGLGEVYPATPINGASPITVLSDCDAIRAVIPEDGPEWNLLHTFLGSSTVPFDPCMIGGIPRDSTEYQRLQFLTRSFWKIAVIAGQGYKDTDVVNGITYYYELRGVDESHVETVLDSDVPITAGAPTLLSAPTGLTAQAGDSKVLLWWHPVAGAAGYQVYRATASLGVFQRVNNATFVVQIKNDLEGNLLSPSQPGFMDFQRWDGYGNPDTHDVDGVSITGPTNGTTYYYKVASVDLLGQTGSLSTSSVFSTPADQTSPRTPTEISVFANDVDRRMEIQWAKVTYDTAGHAESSIRGYQVYRYDIPDGTTAIAVGGLVSQPASGITCATAIDTDPVLCPLYGEQTFWYKIECIDSAGNISAQSAAVAGHLKDVTAPASPKNVRAEGYETFIRILWDPNTEPDMDGYLVYRSLCKFGLWVCDPEYFVGENRSCTEEFKLVGYISQDQVSNLIAAGTPPYLDDTSVPAGSPICYAYVVKAVDQAQNQSGTMPPNPAKETVVCQRLQDRTPPDPAVITKLLARNGSIDVEWIGAPVQDIAAYHVYRSETESGAYTWVGGQTVEIPPTTPVTLTSPYTAAVDCGACREIPLEIREDMSEGSFLDSTVDFKKIYWYKVVGIDQCGNEGPLEKAIPVSTFTYSTAEPSAPVITSVTGTSSSGLKIQWTPTYDSTTVAGFLVYRAEASTGPFLQISVLIQGNEYLDEKVLQEKSYWYRVMQINNTGIESSLSSAVSGSVSP